MSSSNEMKACGIVPRLQMGDYVIQIPAPVYERRASEGIPGSPEHTSALQRRLAKAERDILSLKTRICCDRASWEMRFNEVQRKQEELRMQLRSEVRLRVREDNNDPVDPNTNTTVSESEEHSSTQTNHLEVMASLTSSPCPSNLWDDRPCCTAPSGSRTESLMSSNISVASRRSSRASRRCFAPHSPMDLQPGHQVRIMLPSGRISNGTVRYLGFLHGEPELCLGVELASPDRTTQQDGSHRGQSYFQCDPGYGAFVRFSKLLMAWE